MDKIQSETMLVYDDYLYEECECLSQKLFLADAVLGIQIGPIRPKVSGVLDGRL